MRRTCNPEKSVRIWHGAPSSGKSSAWFEHSIDNRKAAGSTFPDQVFCGQVNRCHAGLISHASGVQLASPQPILGESFNGRTAGLQPANEGSIPSSSTKFAREAVAPLAPSVTVAEWLRRQTVDLSTRVQFPPVTPIVRASFNGEDTSVLTKKCRFDSGRLFQIVWA